MKTKSIVLVMLLLVLSGNVIFAQVKQAKAELRDSAGKLVVTAAFVQEAKGVRIQVLAKDLPPGPHGIHIHAVGKCEPQDFASAGGHFNPHGKKHGLQNPEGPHAGDLPNLEAKADGTAVYEQITDRVTLSGGELSLFDSDGSALVIHANPDDQQTEPTGNSGARIACGVIVPMKTPSMGTPAGAGGWGLLLLGLVGVLLWFLFFRR